MIEFDPIGEAVAAGLPTPAGPGFETLVRRLLDLWGRVSNLESTYLTVIDWERDEQHILFSRNVGEMQIPEGLTVDWSDTLCRRALDGGPATTCDVPGDYPDSAAAKELGITTYVTAPVRDSEGLVFGTLCGASGSSVEISADTRMILETLADMVALHLANDAKSQALADANVELHRMALTDGLTGLANRRGFERDLSRLCHHAVRRNVPVGVIAIDVDHFKLVNDTYGHDVGDEVLRTIAAAIAAHARVEDAVGRMGGDEFLVAIEATGEEDARLVGERIRAAVASTPAGGPDHAVVISISVGAATGAADDPALLIKRADAALYEAKAGGRNTLALR